MQPTRRDVWEALGTLFLALASSLVCFLPLGRAIFMLASLREPPPLDPAFDVARVLLSPEPGEQALFKLIGFGPPK